MGSRPAIIASAAACLAGAFVLGRVTARPKPAETVRTVTKVERVEVQAKAETMARTITLDGPVKVIHRKFACPDGKPSEETVATRDVVRTETVTLTNTVTDVKEHRTHDERVRTVYARDTWSVGAGVGMGLDGRRVGELHVERRVLGNFHLTLSLNTDKVATVGLEYRF